MKITPFLFDAFLKCPTKCWLRAHDETPSGNTYAEWVLSQNEAYRAAQTDRLLAGIPPEESVRSPGFENLKASKWRLAVDLTARTPDPADGSQPAEAPPQMAAGGARIAASNPSVVASGSPLPTAVSPPAIVVESNLAAVERVPSAGRGKAAQFIPIRFTFLNKLTRDHKLLLAFDTFALAQALGRDIAAGKIIHGDLDNSARQGAADSQDATAVEPGEGKPAGRSPAQPRLTKVKTSALVGEVRKHLGKIATLLASPTTPDLVLNRHCAECEFQARCRQKALETDDLSLLAGMSAKERQKLRSKGIFTVTQLSYTFRPRRRPKRLRDKREKYHHSLKALAIREKKIHIVGSPELKIEGTPVYLDVEGLPDRDFYYLIGLRIGSGDSAVQHSLWADIVEDEGKIWQEFLAILETVEKPVLIHYGSYETSFLKQMCERYEEPPEGSHAAEAIHTAINLLLRIFAQVYFPALSNGLKETANTLGYKWAEATASGLKAIAWRRQWEDSREALLKERLAAYNAQDCEGLSVVTNRVVLLTNKPIASAASQTDNADVVQADSEQLQKKGKWRKFTSPVLGFEFANAAGHWDYQRHRVYARSGKPPKRSAMARRNSRSAKREQLVIIWPACRRCPGCNRQGNFKGIHPSRIMHEILFGRQSLKLRLVKYMFRTYRCRKCHRIFGVPDRFSLFRRYGWSLAAYLFYQIVELTTPQRTVVQGFNRLFHFSISKNTVNHIKERLGSYYAETRQTILSNIVRGNLVHADETRANIKGKTGFVWVLTNMDDVFYTLADSREGDMVQKLLPDFKGVLVSDFYTAYDSIGCPQQRCLIHLIRDLNDEVMDNPFDDQLKQIVTAFGLLLKPMMESVDRHGLKRHFLKKHLTEVEGFFRELEKTDWQSEAALKCKDRFERNRDKLFTFLKYDGVPWNNNNAEHAIKAFARVRDVVGGASTEKGLDEYLTLLSVCQTCKYMGVDFLDFLRSGEKDIHAFAESRRRRRSATRERQTPPAAAPLAP